MTKEEYSAAISRLFGEWEAHRARADAEIRRGAGDFSEPGENSGKSGFSARGGFIRDGVVCPDEWFSGRVRPLFLLKEAYGGGNWDLTEMLRSSGKIGRDPTWRRVSEWTYGILSVFEGKSAPYGGFGDVGSLGNRFLRKIAVVNVKKSGGRSDSDMDEIRAYAVSDREFLLRELEICDPTIIICGYTASVLDILFERSIRAVKNENLCYRVDFRGREWFFVDYWHPANHYPDLMNYYGLVGAIKQTMK